MEHVSELQHVADISYCQETSLEPQCPNGKHQPVLHDIVFEDLKVFVLPLGSLQHCPAVSVHVRYMRNDTKNFKQQWK